MHRTLIVARMQPGSEQAIAQIFATSDVGELPGLVGVRRRSLFAFRDVYLHLIEGDRPVGHAVAEVHAHPAFRQVSADLEEFVTPYDPSTWSAPRDAMAREFYTWERA
jgi:cyclase